MQSRVIHLFGKTGAGKSWVAAVFHRAYGCHIYDADQDFTPRMRKATLLGQTYTDEMRDEFYSLVAARAKKLSEESGVIVIPQATYKEKHRKFLSDNIPGYLAVQVVASPEIIEERIVARGGEVTLEYAKRVSAFYEEPPPGTLQLINNSGEKEILEQAAALKLFV